MNIGIIGAGNMGSALGKQFAQLGHSVLFSFSHDNQKLKELASSVGSNAKWGSPKEAAQFGDVILLTVPWPALEEAISAAGSPAGSLARKSSSLPPVLTSRTLRVKQPASKPMQISPQQSEFLS